MDLRRTLKKLRKEHGFTQVQVAKMLDMSSSAYSRWERNYDYRTRSFDFDEVQTVFWNMGHIIAIIARPEEYKGKDELEPDEIDFNEFDD